VRPAPNRARPLHDLLQRRGILRIDRIRPFTQGRDEDLAIIEHRKIAGAPADLVFAFLRRHPRRGDELAQVAPAVGVVRQRDEPETVEAEFAAQDQFERVARGQIQFLESPIRTHHAGHRAFIGDRERAVAELMSPSDQLARMRGPALEAEIREAVQFGVLGQRIHA
jgi:hypothetical protein